MYKLFCTILLISLPAKTYGEFEFKNPDCHTQADVADVTLRLNLNENPFGHSPLVNVAIAEALDRVGFSSVYADAPVAALQQDLAAHFRIDVKNILITPGSTEILTALPEAFAKENPNANFVTHKLAYSEFKSQGKKVLAVREAELNLDLRVNLDNIAKLVDSNTAFVILANPTNPTGHVIPDQLLRPFLIKMRDRGVHVVLDGAYQEYISDSSYRAPYEYQREFANVIAIGTFSKAYGLAGLRVGYTIGGTAETKAIKKAIGASIPSTSALSAVAAAGALRDAPWLLRNVIATRANVADLHSGLRGLGFETYGHDTSFILVRTAIPAKQFTDALHGKGILIHDMTATYDSPHLVRITSGTLEQNKILLAAIKTLGIR